MFDITEQDVKAVYEQLKDRYDLTLTNAFSLDEGYEEDCPVLVGKAHGLVLELYEDGGMFVLDVMNAEQTAGTHWHPNDVAAAAAYVVEFMEGKRDYPLIPYRQH